MPAPWPRTQLLGLPPARRGPEGAPISLINIKTGKTIRGRSATSLARCMGWGVAGQVALSRMWDGRLLSRSGYLLPHVARHRLTIRDVFGNEIRESVRSLMKRGFSSFAIRKLLQDQPVGTHWGDERRVSYVLPSGYTPAPDVAPAPAERVAGYRFSLPKEPHRRGPRRIVTVPRLGDAPGFGLSKYSAWILSRGYKPQVKGVRFAGVVREHRQAPWV